MIAVANKQTIHFIGDIRFISNANGKYKTKKEVVIAHMRYIEKNAVYTSGDRNVILKNCDIFDKRVNSRVAGKTIFALPNDIYSNSYDEWVENIKTVLSECFYVNKEYIYVAIHTEHELQDELKTYNKHAHVIFSPIDKNGKPIRTKISDLKNLHKSWDKLLESYGYEIKRKDKEMSISEFGLGFELRKSKEKRDAYKQYLANERDREWIEKEIREILLYDEEQARARAEQEKETAQTPAPAPAPKPQTPAPAKKQEVKQDQEVKPTAQEKKPAQAPQIPAPAPVKEKAKQDQKVNQKQEVKQEQEVKPITQTQEPAKEQKQEQKTQAEKQEQIPRKPEQKQEQEQKTKELEQEQERLAKEKAEKEAKEKAEQEARERAEKEAKEKAEQEQKVNQEQETQELEQEQKSEKDNIMSILQEMRELTREKNRLLREQKQLEKEIREKNQNNDDGLNWGGGMNP